MGRNNEYADDAVFESVMLGSDDDSVDEFFLEPEEWHDWHSEHVLNMWMSLRQYLEDNYMNNLLMDRASFHDFAEFVRQFSR